MGKRIDFEVPAGARESECRSCGAPIVWIRSGTKPGGAPKWMPLCLSGAQRDATGQLRAESHFATCPEAAKHRAPRPAAPKTWTV